MNMVFKKIPPSYLNHTQEKSSKLPDDLYEHLKNLRAILYSISSTEVIAYRYSVYLITNNIILNIEEFIKSVSSGNNLSILFLNRQLNEIVDDLRVLIYESKHEQDINIEELKKNLEKYTAYILYTEKQQHELTLSETKKDDDIKDELISSLEELVKYYSDLIEQFQLDVYATGLSSKKINSFKRFIDPTSSLSKSMAKFNGAYGLLVFKKESMIMHGNYDSLRIINEECVGGDKFIDYSEGTISHQSQLLEEAYRYLSRIYLRLWPEVFEKFQLND